MRKIFFLVSILALYTYAQNIHIHSNNATPLSKIIEEIASQSNVSVFYLQENVKEMLDRKKTSIHITDKSLQSTLKNLLTDNDFYYTLHKDALKIGFLLTKTFEIHYIATTRVGSSNTDIVFSQDNQIQSLYNNGQFNAISDFEIPSQTHKMAMSKATSNNPNIGKSGTKIYSIDEIDFWGDLKDEIASIAYRPGDSYQPDFTSELKNDNKKDRHIVINKAAGLLTITGTRTQIDRVQKYIHNLNEKIQKQVLIDVHIFNVQHTDNQTYGVDWNEFFKLGNLSILSPNNNIGQGASYATMGTNGTNYEINIFSQGANIDRIVEFLQTYGKVQSISNPKVLTLNNQPAIISVGSVLRYAQNTTYQTTTQGTSVQNNSQAFPSVFAGILLDVTPSIKGNKIILKINPSITKAKDFSVENQSTALNAPPNLSTKQLSSLVQVQDGQKIILGGLIDKTEGQTIRKIPLLGDIPLIKYLFRYKKDIKETQEMIIVISPHIIHLDQKQDTKDLQRIQEIEDFSQSHKETSSSVSETQSEPSNPPPTKQSEEEQ